MEVTKEMLDSWVKMSKSQDLNDQKLLFDIINNNNISKDIVILLCCTSNTISYGFWDLIKEFDILHFHHKEILYAALDIVSNDDFDEIDIDCISCNFESYPKVLSMIQGRL